MAKAKTRVTCAGTARMATTFRGALEDLYQLAQPVIVGGGSTTPAAAPV